MALPEDTHLAYTVTHEAWYARSLPDDRREINITASAPGGGVAWEFTVEEVDLGSHGPAIRVKVFDDAFAAFAQIPQFFANLAGGKVKTLDEVRDVLRLMGAVDETERRGPDHSAPAVATAKRIERAIASLSVTRPGPDGLVQVNAENAAAAVLRVLGADSDAR